MLSVAFKKQAATWGIVGAMLGLIHQLDNLSDVPLNWIIP